MLSRRTEPGRGRLGIWASERLDAPPDTKSMIPHRDLVISRPQCTINGASAAAMIALSAVETLVWPYLADFSSAVHPLNGLRLLAVRSHDKKP